jgi:hypothetical protein
MDVARGGLNGRLAQLGEVVGRMRAVLRRRHEEAGRVRTLDEDSFEVHVEQALRIARGLPALHVVQIDDSTVARSGT